MQNNMKKPGESKKELFDFVYGSASSNQSNSPSTGDEKCIVEHELEIMKESINQLRQSLHLLIMEPEYDLGSEEVLCASQALDNLIGDYHKAFGYFKELVHKQERTVYPDRRCCHERD